LDSPAHTATAKVVGTGRFALMCKNRKYKALGAITTPIRERLDIGELIREQNYKHPSKEELDEIVQEADIQEPIEDLLNMI